MRLFGFHAVVQAWLNPRRPCHRLLLTTQAHKEFEGTLVQAKARGIKRPSVEIVEAHTINHMLPQGSVHQGMLLEADNPPEPSLDDILESASDCACVVVLDQVTDPHNVGAILRSACAFGAKAVMMTERHAPSVTGTLAKTACGAFDVIPLVRLTNLSQALQRMQKEGFWCIGLAEEGPRALHEMKLPQKVAIVLGAEGEGLRRLTREKCDELAKLPTQPPIGSLNVSNAAAIAIYEITRQISAS